MDQKRPSNFLQPSAPSLRKRRSSEQAEDQNSPRESPQLYSESDRDLLLLLRRERQYKEDKARREGRRVKRGAVRCCKCEIEILSSEKCSCEHKFCCCCFKYDDYPLSLNGLFPTDYDQGVAADTEYDNLWKVVREFLKSRKGERISSSLSS